MKKLCHYHSFEELQYAAPPQSAQYDLMLTSEVNRISRIDAMRMGLVAMTGHRYVDGNLAGEGTPDQIRWQLTKLQPLEEFLETHPDTTLLKNMMKPGKMRRGI